MKTFALDSNGKNLLDDLDSFTVAPLRPGPPVVKDFYAESALIANRPQVKSLIDSMSQKRSFHFLFQHVTDQFYVQNEMSVQGFAPKPILSFDEVQFPGEHPR